jgi:two-component system response regulator MprA
MTRTILVVDDEEAIVEMLSMLLEDEGYRVVTAHDGCEGLEKVAAERPDVVLSDITMPRCDGLGLCRGMRADPALWGIPLVFASAIPQQLVPQDCPYDAYVCKPFAFDDVLAALASVLVAADGDGTTPRGS